MVQLNLLPDVKLEYIKAQRQRRLVASISILITALAVLLLVALLLVDVAQKKHLNDLSNNIANESSTLQQEPQISQVLTVQNQLENLTSLHAAKPNASQLFSYLADLTPPSVAITSLHVDFTQNAMTITGTADTLNRVNQYVDSLKTAQYTTDSNSGSSAAFSNVVLSSFGLNSGAPPSQAVNYTVTLSYDKNIFDITQNVKLVVPNRVSTGAGLIQPGALFQPVPTTNGGGAKSD